MGTSSFRPGDRVSYNHDARTVLRATIIGPFDDGWVICLDAGLEPEIAARVFGASNAHFIERGVAPDAPDDPLFVATDTLRLI